MTNNTIKACFCYIKNYNEHDFIFTISIKVLKIIFYCIVEISRTVYTDHMLTLLIKDDNKRKTGKITDRQFRFCNSKRMGTGKNTYKYVSTTKLTKPCEYVT